MTMTDTPEVKAPARKKPKKKAAPRQSAAAPKPEGKFAGMSVKDCPAACNINGCVISGKPYCAHPRKCGLQPAEMSDSGALARRKDAERCLRDQLLRVE
jgi:hypothetical protein